MKPYESKNRDKTGVKRWETKDDKKPNQKRGKDNKKLNHKKVKRGK
jgi:hypothetical protein